jgi:hypothetical protein
MKFFIPCDKIPLLENVDYESLVPAEFNYQTRSITLYQYSNGEIFTTDEYFASFFAIKTGYRLPIITDQEYAQYILDKKAFFSKARAEQIRAGWAAFLPQK